MENDFKYGNFTREDVTQFPIDCETMETLQNNTRLMSVIARIAGAEYEGTHLLILSGCKKNGARRTAGYVYISGPETADGGEILYHPEQPDSATCFIQDIHDDVAANGQTFSQAYTTRRLISGNGPNAHAWKNFTDIATISNAELSERIEQRYEAVNKKVEDNEKALNVKVEEARKALTEKVENIANSLKNIETETIYFDKSCDLKTFGNEHSFYSPGVFSDTQWTCVSLSMREVTRTKGSVSCIIKMDHTMYLTSDRYDPEMALRLVKTRGYSILVPPGSSFTVGLILGTGSDGYCGLIEMIMKYSVLK